MLVSMGILTLVVSGALLGMSNVMRSNDTVVQMAAMNNALRTGMDLMIRDLDARLALARENETLRHGSTPQEDNRIAELNRRLQAETAEKERLRRELERAEAKLEAIATLESGNAEPRP